MIFPDGYRYLLKMTKVCLYLICVRVSVYVCVCVCVHPRTCLYQVVKNNNNNETQENCSRSENLKYFFEN